MYITVSCSVTRYFRPCETSWSRKSRNKNSRSGKIWSLT